jgi:transposase
MWNFSNHAKTGTKERGFSTNDILKVLDEEIPSIVLQSPREDTVDLYFSKINTKYLLIVVDRITHVIITVRPMRKNEKDQFVKEMTNG